MTKDVAMAQELTDKLKTDIKTVGAMIREIRISQGISQVRLAEMIGVRQPVISRIEAGTHVPTWRTLDRIAKALDASIFVDVVVSESE